MNKIDKHWQDDHFSEMSGMSEAERTTYRLLRKEKELEKLKLRESNHLFSKFCLLFILVLGGITAAYYIGAQIKKPNTINENTSITVNKNSFSNTHTTVNAQENHNEKINPIIIEKPLIVQNTEVVTPVIIVPERKPLTAAELEIIRQADIGINQMSKEYATDEITRLKCVWELTHHGGPPASTVDRIQQLQSYYRNYSRMTSIEQHNLNNSMDNAQADFRNATRLLNYTVDHQNSLKDRIDKAQARKNELLN